MEAPESALVAVTVTEGTELSALAVYDMIAGSKAGARVMPEMTRPPTAIKLALLLGSTVTVTVKTLVEASTAVTVYATGLVKF